MKFLSVKPDRELTSPRKVAGVLLAAAIASVLVGCGDDTGNEVNPTIVMISASQQPVTVTATDFDFDPDTLVVAGEGTTTSPVPIELTLQNSGSVVHNLVILRDGQEIADTSFISRGQTSSLTTSLDPGEYQFMCTVGDHAELGMVGELQVQ
jgi:plastocyanin